MPQDIFDRQPHGITVIDTGFMRPRFDAAYLIVEAGRAAFIDTGPNLAVPRLLEALRAQGLGPEAVDWVIVTHVHLDHAGGAGLLMQHLPHATLAVHPRGARHMADPGLLMEGVRAVYGAEVADRDYGELRPVSAQRILETCDGMTLELAGRPLSVIDTPGHARHHHCVWDEASQGWFTGDTFGMAYPELETPRGRYALPTTTPVQFEPDAMRASIDRLLARDPQVMYLTHFGATREVASHARQVLDQMDEMVRLARTLAVGPGRPARLRQAFADLYRDAWRRLGGSGDDAAFQSLLAGDVELNAQGVEIWSARQART